jgi:hypothetical protein
MTNPVDALITLLQTRQRKVEIERALMGRADGTVDYVSLPNYVYIRIGGNESQVAIARNVTTPQIKDLPIDVERISDNNRVTYNVLGISKSLNPTMATGITPAIKQVPKHGFAHEFTAAGYDPVNLYPRGIAALRCNAQSTPNMTVVVSFGWYEIDGNLTYYAGGTSPAFTADGDSYDVLCINAAGTLSIVAGAHGTWPTGIGGFGGGTPPVFPAIGDGKLAIGCVMVRLNMTTIGEKDLTYDPRAQFTKSVSGGNIMANQFLLMGA